MAIDRLVDFREVTEKRSRPKHKTGKATDTSKPKPYFIEQARLVGERLAGIRKFILEHRAAYLEYLPGTASLSEADRTAIDEEVATCLQDTKLALDQLSPLLALDTNPSKNAREHKLEIIKYLEQMLKKVAALQLELQNARRQHITVIKASTPRFRTLDPETLQASTVVTDPRYEPSQEEAQLFEKENAELLSVLEKELGEWQKIEKTVLEIATYQQQFATHLVEQRAEIDTIHETVVTSGVNLQQGNDQLRKAMENSAEMRVWILVFLLLVSFILLFLDSY